MRAARIDSTVVEADIRYPTDLGLAADAAGRSRAEAARAANGWPVPARRGSTDRSRSVQRRLRKLNRSIARAHRPQQAATALRLTGEAGELVGARSARRAGSPSACAAVPAGAAPAQARRRRAPRAARRRAEKVCPPDPAAASRASRSPIGWCRSATPTRGRSARASCAQPTEFGYVMQLAELCENTRRGARGLILPPPPASARPTSPTCLPATGPTGTASPAPARDRARRRLLPRPRRRAPARRQRPSSAAATRRLATHQPPPGAVPRRRRRPHQPPQAPLRPAPITPERPPRRPHLGRPGRSSPTTSTPSPSEPPDSITTGRTPPETPTTRTAASPPERGRSSFPQIRFIRGK